jgi:hypothetical protein
MPKRSWRSALRPLLPDNFFSTHILKTRSQERVFALQIVCNDEYRTVLAAHVKSGCKA